MVDAFLPVEGPPGDQLPCRVKVFSVRVTKGLSPFNHALSELRHLHQLLASWPAGLADVHQNVDRGIQCVHQGLGLRCRYVTRGEQPRRHHCLLDGAALTHRRQQSHHARLQFLCHFSFKDLL